MASSPGHRLIRPARYDLYLSYITFEAAHGWHIKPNYQGGGILIYKYGAVSYIGMRFCPDLHIVQR